MVEQRPDVRAAESNLHSASALVGVADRQPVPQHHAQRRHQHPVAEHRHAVRAGRSPAPWSARNVLQTIIDGGALAARKRAAQAGLEQADAQYRSTVLGAFRNVADTLARAGVRRAHAEGRGRRRAGDGDEPRHRAAPARARRHDLHLRADRRARLSAGVAPARAGAGGALHRHCRAVPGAGRRLVESRPARARPQGRTAALPSAGTAADVSQR